LVEPRSFERTNRRSAEGRQRSVGDGESVQADDEGIPAGRAHRKNIGRARTWNAPETRRYGRYDGNIGSSLETVRLE